MRSFLRTLRFSAQLAAGAAVLFTASGSALGQQILGVHEASFSTYKPTSATAIQGLRPLPHQRGTNLDGSLHFAPAFSMALPGNPFENAWIGHERLGDLAIEEGTWSPLEVDIALPCKGRAKWIVGRSYNARQKNSGGSYFDSDGYQGKNWQQLSQPEIVFYDDASNANDLLYLVYGADRFVEFKRFNGSSNQFQATNGAAGVFDYQAGTPDLWVYHDQVGTKFTFLGFDTTSNSHNGLLWKIEDEDANVSFVGHATTVATAISSGWDANGRITTAYDSSDRRYTYSYTTLDSVVRLTQVKAETKTGGTWASPTGVAEVAKVDYAYYTNETYGDVGGLKQATTTLPLTDSGISSTSKTYYRYWEGAFNASTNPGHAYGLKYVYEAEGLRQYDYSGDANFDEDFLSASNATLDTYAAAYFEYDSDHRITKAWFHGECGCGGGNNGTHEFTYETMSYSSTGSYDAASAARTIVKRPDASYLTQEFDETGQAMDLVESDIAPGTGGAKYWVRGMTRGSTGIVTQTQTPENVSAYTHSTGAKTKETATGAVLSQVRETSGNLTGFLLDQKHAKGTVASAYFDLTLTYTTLSKTIGDTAVVRPLIASRREYTLNDSTTTTGSNVTSYSYTGYSSTLQPEFITVTHPAVSTANNGSNSTTLSYQHLRKDGLVDFERSTEDRITYRAYTNGLLVTEIQDVDTAHSDLSGVTIPSSPVSFASSGTELHRKTLHEYDAQGRRTKATNSWGSNAAYETQFTYHSRLKDQRLVTIGYPEWNSTPTFYGPASHAVRNLAGKTEVQGVVAVNSGLSTAALTTHIDETDGDPITAVDTGSSFGALAQMMTFVYDESGSHLEEERRYFSLPSSGAGTEGTHYDATRYGYDSNGRRWRVKEPTGTIHRTVRDSLGRQIESWMGTNDSSFTGGESSGTDNMVKTEIREYDGGSDKKNSLLTTLTKPVQDSSTDERVTTYSYDDRGRLLLESPPSAPYAFHKVDNLNRRIATGLFSGTGSITLTSDDPTAETTNRLALTQTFYDERGQVWKTQRHKIDPSDGSDDDNLQSLTWYDAAGRVTKVKGETFAKTAYDRLGRQTDEYILGKSNDSAYADADDVSGDVVDEQHENRYDPTNGTVILRAVVARYHTDFGIGQTTGALDTNADADDLLLTAANLKGRAQITGRWYDTVEREADRVEFGTYGVANFDRDGMSVPARSDTALRWTSTYNTDGTLQEVTDPRALVQRFEYDALGRRTKEIKNYGDGTPSGTDSDVTIRYEYANGLRTKYIADVPGTDQETLYIYGTTKGTPSESKIATGHLLRATKYPDSTNGGTTNANINSDSSDVVSQAYNAQGQEVLKKDQGGNVIETVYDTRGRVATRKVSTLGSGFDGAVRRIVTAYDTLGRSDTVTQWDAASSGSVVDEVKYSYDYWGNLSKFEQDRNSTVAGGGDDYEVSYTWVKATNGRNTLRRDTVTLPSGKVLTYDYSTQGSKHDEEASRVTNLKDGATVLVTYNYNGVGQVVGTDYPEPDVMSKQFTSTGVYPDLDLFNRVVTSKWTKDLATDKDFYHVDLTYDRNSNITTADDTVHAGFDVKYAMDNVDRLTDADEGTLSSGSITSRTRRQQWTLNQTGNWDHDLTDLNGDGDGRDADELDDTRTHNEVNELLARDIDSDSSDDYALDYDGNGNVTDDGESYEYEWDAFGRLRKVKNTSGSALIAEYRYNGLGYRIAVHEDTDTDADVDGNDKWYYDALDERWRQVARFRETDTSPKEEFVHHCAGSNGSGTASYVDLVVCRDKDANTAWTSASDGTLEDRVYYCQNQHADLSAVVSSSGSMREWIRYSAFGVPFGLPAADTDSDGDCDATDTTLIQTWISNSQYDIRGDVDLDGDVDSVDKTQSTVLTATAGRSVLSPHTLSRWGIAGYEYGPIHSYQVRNRVLAVSLGQWLRRDPLEYYSGGMSLYQYVGQQPLIKMDPTGMAPDWWDTFTGCIVSVPPAPPGVEVPTVICDGRNNGANPDQSTCIMNGGHSSPAVRDTDMAIVCTKDPPKCCVCNTEGMSYCSVMEAGTMNCETFWGSTKQVNCQCYGPGSPEYDQAQQALRRCANGQRPFP